MKMKTSIIATLLVAMGIAMPLWCSGQGRIETFFAIGPGYGNPTYVNFMDNMLLTMYGNSLAPVAFIPNGGITSATNVMTDGNNIGRSLYCGFSENNSVPFTLNQIQSAFWTSLGGRTNLLSGASFGPGVMGIKWGPGGQGTGDTIYHSGNADTILVNQVFVVSDIYSFHIGSDTIPQGLSAFMNIFGPKATVGTSYIHGTTSAYGTVDLAVPEPSSISLVGIGLGAYIFRRKNK